MAEEAQPVVGVYAREGELRQVRNIDVEGRHEGQAGRCAERVEQAAVEADAEERFVRAASVEDDVVACRLAGCVVGRFEVELGDEAEARERAVQWWVEVRGGVLGTGAPG